MPKGAVTKRCVECKRITKANAGVIQWCDCGGELRAISYGRRVKRGTRG